VTSDGRSLGIRFSSGDGAEPEIAPFLTPDIDGSIRISGVTRDGLRWRDDDYPSLEVYFNPAGPRGPILCARAERATSVIYAVLNVAAVREGKPFS